VLIHKTMVRNAARDGRDMRADECATHGCCTPNTNQNLFHWGCADLNLAGRYVLLGIESILVGLSIVPEDFTNARTLGCVNG
jgi:hypothetical protein